MKSTKKKFFNKKKRFIKKGSGFFSNLSKKVSNAYTSVKNTTSNSLKSAYQNSRNLVKSAKDIGSSGKYLFSLIANPANTHRILFKNAHFIDFIDFKYIERLYCNRDSSCVRLEEGYLYSNNPSVIQQSEQAVNKDITDLIANANSIQPDNSVPPEEAAKIKQIVEKTDIASLKEENSGPVSSFIDKTFKRLAFAKLNDAILTDNEQLANFDSQYIVFKNINLFEFFHTYKYQVNRCLWYGGWRDWMYVTDQITNLFLINDTLSNDFLNELWGTVGLMKLIIKYPKDKRDKLINVIKSGQQEKALQETNAQGKSLADSKLQEMNKNVESNGPPTSTSRFSSFNRTVRNGINSTGNFISNAIGTNISKYRVYRNLLKYYDIDIGKYNMNMLKTTGILKSNYPVFMVREAQKAVQIAINNLSANRNNSIINVNTNIENIDIPNIQVSNFAIKNKNNIMEIENAKLDYLINKLLLFNVDTQNVQKTGGNKNKNKLTKNKTRRTSVNVNMTGGSKFFFLNLEVIFKACFQKMIGNQLKILNEYAMKSGEKSEYISHFFAEIIRCLGMMTITLCLTLANYALYTLPLPLATPHCVISNLMFMYVIFKMRLLNMEQINVIQKLSLTMNNSSENEDKSE